MAFVGLLRCGAKQTLLRRSIPVVSQYKGITSNEIAIQEMRDFWHKNEVKLQRPLSPHVTIYKQKMTGLSSITFRITGTALAIGIYGGAYILPLMNSDFTTIIQGLKDLNWHPSIWYGFKFGIAWSFLFHTFNGFRHLSWDTGRGFKLATLYKTGYISLGSSIVAAAICTML